MGKLSQIEKNQLRAVKWATKLPKELANVLEINQEESKRIQQKLERKKRR